MDYPWSLSAQSRDAITGLSACIRRTRTITILLIQTHATHDTNAWLTGDNVAAITSAYSPRARGGAHRTTAAAAIASFAIATSIRPRSEDLLSIGRDHPFIGLPDIWPCVCTVAPFVSHVGQSGPASACEGGWMMSASHHARDRDTHERSIAAGYDPCGGDDDTPWPHIPHRRADGDDGRILEIPCAAHNRMRGPTGAGMRRDGVDGARRVATTLGQSPSSSITRAIDGFATRRVLHLPHLLSNKVIVTTGDAPRDVLPDRRPHAHKRAGGRGACDIIDRPPSGSRHRTREGRSLTSAMRPAALTMPVVDAIRDVPTSHLGGPSEPISPCARRRALSLTEPNDRPGVARTRRRTTRLRTSRRPTSARAPPRPGRHAGVTSDGYDGYGRHEQDRESLRWEHHGGSHGGDGVETGEWHDDQGNTMPRHDRIGANRLCRHRAHGGQRGAPWHLSAAGTIRGTSSRRTPA